MEVSARTRSPQFRRLDRAGSTAEPGRSRPRPDLAAHALSAAASLDLPRRTRRRRPPGPSFELSSQTTGSDRSSATCRAFAKCKTRSKWSTCGPVGRLGTRPATGPTATDSSEKIGFTVVTRHQEGEIMLVLSRKQNERIVIGSNITITILEAAMAAVARIRCSPTTLDHRAQVADGSKRLRRASPGRASFVDLPRPVPRPACSPCPASTRDATASIARLDRSRPACPPPVRSVRPIGCPLSRSVRRRSSSRPAIQPVAAGAGCGPDIRSIGRPAASRDVALGQRHVELDRRGQIRFC